MSRIQIPSPNLRVSSIIQQIEMQFSRKLRFDRVYLQTAARLEQRRCLAWRPIQGIPRVCPRHWQEPQLACVLVTLLARTRRAAAKTGMGRLVFFPPFESPATPIPDRHAKISMSNTIRIASSVTSFSCVKTNLPTFVDFLWGFPHLSGDVY